MRISALLLLCGVLAAPGATLNVPGTYATIQAAVNASAAGDTILVAAGGTYNEEVTITQDGNSGAWINLIGNGSVMRRFTMNGANYVRLINFELTHVDNTYNGVIVLDGTCTHLDILNNYIHHCRGRASGEGAVVSSTGSGITSYVTLRDNFFFHIGYLAGVFSFANIADIYSDFGTSHHWLIEYNHLQRSADFLYNYGQDHIVRNNWLHDVSASYWPSGGGLPHTDFSQIGSDGLAANTMRQVFEANFCYDNNEPDGHGYLQQNNPGTGTDTDHLLRGNIWANLGSGVIASMNTPNTKVYNNTIYSVVNVASDGIIYRQWGANNPTGCLFANNIIHSDGNSTDNIAIETGSATVVTNLGYQAGSETSYILTTDPQFVDPTSPARNFHLGSGSPARGASANLLNITSATGSGTTFNVNDGLLLTDGKGITSGDIVRIGSTTTRVTSISGNAVTVAASVSWTQGDPVYWNGVTSRDLGALPFGSSILTSATYTKSGNDYAVTTVGDARGVWFYTNDIPALWVYDQPYTATIANSGTVTIKAYALYTQTNMVVDVTLVSGLIPATKGSAPVRGFGISP